MNSRILIILFIALAFSSCKKNEVIVPDNNPPADHTITNSTIENYVTKVYISVLGREPDSLEKQNGLAILNANNLSSPDRAQLLDTVLSKPEYYTHNYDVANTELLNNLDTSQITQFIYVFSFLLTDSANAPFFSILQFELDRLIAMQNIDESFANGSASLVDLHKTFCNNYFYDQINMGSLNFVVSLFQNFLSRYPTENELNAGIAMVDGNTSIVFLQTGDTKEDFIDIFFNSDDYYEGQVRDLYLKYLLREPSSTELSTYTIQYKNSHDYKALQKSILMLDEFVFL